MRRSLAALAAAAVLAGSALGATGAAAADGPLAPGQTRTVVLAVPGTWAEQAAQVEVTALRLEQAENGCLEVEAAAGDDCTSDLGELAGLLVPTVAWGRTVAGECRAGGPAVRLDLFGTTTARLTEVDGIDCLVLDLSFPHGNTDNLAQSDTLAFGLELAGQGLAGPADAAADPGAPGPDADPVDGDAGGAGPSVGVTGQGAGARITGPQVTATTGDGVGGVGQQGTGQPDSVPAGAGTVDAGAAGGGAAGAGTVGAAGDGGPVLDRVEAQVEVGGDGVGVQTQAASTSLELLVLAWGGALLGMVGLGWLLFLLVRRRRRRAEATA